VKRGTANEHKRLEEAAVMEDQRSRILTTHVGSLPRRPDVSEMMIARLDGRSVDQRAYTDALASSVDDCVRWQARLGLDLVSDGEQSKP
jgi:5-methyltetrahydropteroyltriglutamate--homocysteine methyltransferase